MSTPLTTVIAMTILAGVASGVTGERKVLSTSPNRNIEIYTKGYDSSQEEVRPWAKGGILGKGIYARFIGEDTPDQTLWEQDETSFEAEIEWDSSSTRLYISQGVPALKRC